jgi:thiamine-monophosphate kinase
MNEFKLIELITSDVHSSSEKLRCGIGDDCAVIGGSDCDLIVSTDSFVEGIHFKLLHFTPSSLGKRIFNASVSDIAAMGGLPKFFTLSLCVPEGFGSDRCAELYDGLKREAFDKKTTLIGGDTTKSAELVLTMTVIGEAASGRTILRSGARPGDALYVTGTLGDAALGLACLDADSPDDFARPFVARYRNPAARIDAGHWLASTDHVSSMIDISDGLLADVEHLADSSGTGYEVALEALPRSEGFEAAAGTLGLGADMLMLTGGDDYELAFTVKEDRVEAFEGLLKGSNLPFGHAVTRIGSMTGDVKRRVALDKAGNPVSVTSGGYVHSI